MLELEPLFSRIAALERRLQDMESIDSVPVIAVGTSNSGQSIPNNVLTAVNFNATPRDTRSAVGTFPNWRFTAPVGGDYFVSACILMGIFDANWAVGETAYIVVYKNGAAYRVLDAAYDLSAGGSCALSGGTEVLVAKNDYLEIYAFQTSGAAQLLHGDALFNWVSIHRIRGY